MKVLHLFDFFSPPGGGLVDLIFRLTRALAHRGHEVVIYASDHKLDRKYIASLPEVNVYPFHCISSLAGFYIMPDIVGAVRDDLKTFDIIHVHTARSFQNMVVHYYAKKHKVPYVLDTHGTLPRMIQGKRRFKWLLKCLFDISFGNRILRDANRVVAETELGVEEYKEFGVREDKIVLIPPPFAVEEFSQLPPSGQFRNRYEIKDKHIVMFLGRIHQIKGLDFLVEAFYELTSSRNDIILAIVGSDDGYKSGLEKLINRLALADKVLFTGFLAGEEKLSALVDADAVVQTSRYEYGTGAPFEAVLCGTPIIVTKHTGAGEDVKRLDAGYLVEFGNKKELAEIINKILSNPFEARKKAKKAAQYIRGNRSMVERISEYEKLYLSCIEEAKAT